MDQDVKFNPTISSRDTEPHSAPITIPQSYKGGSFSAVKTIGSLAGFEYLTRNSDASFHCCSTEDCSSWFIQVASNQTFEALQLGHTFANGSTIPNGDYRVLIRALRVTGNPANEEDYETWLSPIFGIRVPP